MARLAARSKLLFYPTPLAIIETIATNIVSAVTGPDERAGAICDPCCGTGEPLAWLGNHLGLTTYGNELHPARYTQAKSRLDTCLNGAREFLEIEGEFSLIFDNPPYDQALSGERMELAHIAADLELLAPDGLGLWVIPEPILNQTLCTLLATHLHQLNLRRFPSPEYDRFKQVVIFGLKRGQPQPNVYSLTNALLAQIRRGLPVLQPGELAYRYPVGNPIRRFRLKFPAASTLLAELEEYGVQQGENWSTLFAADGQLDRFQPLLRLNSGHTALVIAAGIVNGTEVTIDGRPHLIKGSTGKRVLTRQETELTEDGAEEIIREREILVQTITALNLHNGTVAEYNSLDDQHGFAEFLLHHQQAHG